METEGCACLPHGHYVKHLLYATDVDVDGEATGKWTLVHCLSNLHNFIETYGENKALNGKKKKKITMVPVHQVTSTWLRPWIFGISTPALSSTMLSNSRVPDVSQVSQ